ncbi:MAG: Ig-like domain-containing protein [Methylococcaceae bacterium]|nr:Ig-like domain-containing protein [Methylococcaceae bacterium]
MKGIIKASLYLFFLFLISTWARFAVAETLEQYVSQCDAAIPYTVTDFNCDNGTEVPISHYTAGASYPNGDCDEPNRLNKECDPGSRFTVLKNDPSAYIVAHCRKKGLGAGHYGDIAVIQYNRSTGATCFYQALGDLDGANVKAPSKGRGAWPWLPPDSSTELSTSGIGCVRCHDNGPIIRSPYLAQITGPNALPGATDNSFNSTQPYVFVGRGFSSWKVYSVEVAGNLCLNCHRLGVSNIASGVNGTAIDFGMRATAHSEVHKNPYSSAPNASHIWMPPGSTLFNQGNADAAKQIHDCALRITENPLPDSPSCKITEYTGTAIDNGDPHLTTVNGIHYDFQSAGEFVALRSGSLEIQTRQTPIATTFLPGANSYTGLATCVSLNTAVAARVGAHRVSYQPNLNGVPDPSGLQLRVDGTLVKLGERGIDLGNGGRVAKSPLGEGIQINFPDGTLLVVTPGWWDSQGKWYLNVNAYHTPATAGIMGNIGDGGWLPALPDGLSLGPKPVALHDRYTTLYGTFADAWRVTDATSLFDYAAGTSTATFTLAGWPKENPTSCVIPEAPVAKPVDVRTAERHCRAIANKNGKDDCVFDVMVTGNPGFAQTYLLTQQLQPGATETLVQDDKDPTRLGESVTFTATVALTVPTGGSAPTGMVQFMLDGGKVGNPIMLDPNGRAMWSTSNLQIGKHQIAANYIPNRGSVLASSSPEKSHTVMETLSLYFWLVILLIIILVLIIWGYLRTK